MSIEAMKLALEALELANGMLERADCSTGYCCCGSLVDGHTIGDGHSPVDEGEYFQSKANRKSQESIKALEEALKQEQGEPVKGLKFIHKADIDLAKKREQEQGEPVAFMAEWSDWRSMVVQNLMRHGNIDKDLARRLAHFYQDTTPQQRKPLTREVIDRDFHGRVDFVRQVEAAHEIKE